MWVWDSRGKVWGFEGGGSQTCGAILGPRKCPSLLRRATSLACSAEPEKALLALDLAANSQVLDLGRSVLFLFSFLGCRNIVCITADPCINSYPS